MTDENNFDQVVVITGASAGLGRTLVREFARHHSKIGILARGTDGIKAAKREAEELGGEAIAIPTDISDSSQVESAAKQVEEAFGTIDVWINNAMVSVFSPLKKIKPEEFKQVTDVTYLGQVYGTMAALKRMLPRDKGTIILVGSALAYRGIPLQSAYCGAKHGIHGFFESLRSELIHDKSNIQLSMMQLPAMNTTQFEFVKSRLPNKPRPMGTIYEPEVAAKAIFNTVIHPQREVYVGYPTVQTIVGNKILPGFLDNYLAKKGYKGQQTNEAAEEREDNLWKPVPGDHGAHGDFTAKSWCFSPKFWAEKHPWLAWAGAATLGIGIGAVINDFLDR